MNRSNYFLTTPLSKWSTGRVMEFLLNKRINLTPSEKELITSGKVDFTNPRIKLFRKIFVVNGISIYLAMRERIEKEEMIQSKARVSPSPSAQSVNPQSPSPSAPSVLSPMLSPSPPLLQSPSLTAAKALVMSDLILEPRIIDTVEKIQLREFINKHPPLLWQMKHFNYFLETLSINIEISVDVNVDELIFYDADNFERLFPRYGNLIYEKLRERFIKKDIVYIKPTERLIDKPTIMHIPRMDDPAADLHQ